MIWLYVVVASVTATAATAAVDIMPVQVPGGNPEITPAPMSPSTTVGPKFMIAMPPRAPNVDADPKSTC
jgi:hypothetical protein